MGLNARCYQARQSSRPFSGIFSALEQATLPIGWYSQHSLGVFFEGETSLNPPSAAAVYQ